MFLSFGSLMMSAEISTAGTVPVFLHQCAVPEGSFETSPALCTIATVQWLAYSRIVPETT